MYISKPNVIVQTKKGEINTLVATQEQLEYLHELGYNTIKIVEDLKVEKNETITENVKKKTNKKKD